MKTSLVEEMWLGGIDGPQYSPMKGAAFESPSYKVKESSLLKLNYFNKNRILMAA